MNRIVSRFLIVVVICMSGNVANAQAWKSWLNKTLKDNNINTGQSNQQGGTSINNLSNNEVVSGLREALQVGTKNAASKLSAVNGFFGNPLIKIPMPPEAQNVETTLRNIGLGSYVDQAVLAMNRAAEDASSKAVPIFVNAIKGMTINDGINILRGTNDAATQYLKAKTSAALTQAFKPVIEGSLAKVDATKYWNQVFTAYNKVPFVKRINPDLTAYVTERALNGLFVSIAQEEAKIRANPSARVTDLLQKVFGAHE